MEKEHSGRRNGGGPKLKPRVAARKSGTKSQIIETSTLMHLMVGIGASAGGLQAFKTFFSNMPSDSGMSFILIQHLDPQHRSMLVELLAPTTAMHVLQAADGMKVEANTIYVIPPNATLRIREGALQLDMPAPAREFRRPVDSFFSALAEDQGENAVCIVLSGGGSDGSAGLRAVKDHGGLTIAQADFEEHALSGMPKNAADTGLVDYVLRIEEMPARLLEYGRHLRTIEPRKTPDGTREDTIEHLPVICAILRGVVGHDFSQYKEKTLVRRIQRRMQVLQIDAVQEYVERLRKGRQECQLLFREFLIGVTHFFRDRAAFEALEREAIPTLLYNKSGNGVVRVWVPACATGEEVYSIAILLRETARTRGDGAQFQIFGTDIDDNAIAVARAARYHRSLLAEVSPERIARWFVPDGEHVSLVKEIREMCIFSTHSIIKDPPFSRLDLISCRNLLIYLNVSAQERAIRTFQYALRSGGILFLGTSESVSRHGKLFEPVDQKNRIFRRRDSPNVPAVASSFVTIMEPPLTAKPAQENDIDKIARRAMEKHLPAYVVVDRNHDVLRFSGSTEKYLGPTPGAASLNLFTLIRRALRSAARKALADAAVTRQVSIQEAVPFEINGAPQLLDLVAEPVPGDDSGFYVLAFRDRLLSERSATSAATDTTSVAALERELQSTRERLQASVDQLEAANEEMKSANEEYQSVNEELQSTNEELETSKEEMQSINEELQTVNSELNSKNDSLLHVNSDLKNLLDSTQIATLFLDRQLRVKNFTPAMTDLFHLRDGDRGRPLLEIASRFAHDNLRQDAQRVLRDLSVVEREVRVEADGTAFLMRLRPYRTVDNVIDGVVITFVDITERQRAFTQRGVLLQELSHRVKNTLASVQSIAIQTFRNTETREAFQDTFFARLMALARTHDLLSRSEWKSVSLRELTLGELEPFGQNGSARYALHGEDIQLEPAMVLAFGLLFHELATNAAKYGALSVVEGRVDVSWAVTRREDARHLRLQWIESGGPGVEKPKKRGLGSRLIESALKHELNCEAHLDFDPSGVRMTIDVPLG